MTADAATSPQVPRAAPRWVGRAARWGVALIGVGIAMIVIARVIPQPRNAGIRSWRLVVVRGNDGSLEVRPFAPSSVQPSATVAVVDYEHWPIDRGWWSLGRRGAAVSFVTTHAAGVHDVDAAWSVCAKWLGEHDPLLPDPVPSPGVVTVFDVVGGKGDLILQQVHDALRLARLIGVVGVALLAIASVRRLASSPYRRRAGRCEACGYSLRGVASTVCPECGAALLAPGERRLEG